MIFCPDHRKNFDREPRVSFRDRLCRSGPSEFSNSSPRLGLVNSHLRNAPWERPGRWIYELS